MQKNDSADNLAPPDLRIRYSDFEHLGSGGMGIVLGARDEHLNRTVAIKLLPRNSENALAVMRFQQEAKAVSKLNNPHIVQVLDFGYTAGGEPYLVMERVTGESLEDILTRKGSLFIQSAIRIATQLSIALEHAHANEVVHRDLKPGNIMLDQDSNVKVLDFGLARILSLGELDWRLTRPGQPLGSLLYMSPEQIRGEEADARSDVFSLGLIIIKMVTGALPWEGLSTMEIVRSRLEEQPPTISAVGEDQMLREALNKVVQNCLNLDREKRYANMTDLKVDLWSVSNDPQRFLERISSKSGKATRNSTSFLVVCALSLLLVLLPLLFFTMCKTEKAKGHQKKHPATINGESFKTARERFIKDKFRIVGDPEHGVWYADRSVRDKEVAMLSGLKIFDISFEGNHNIKVAAMETISRLPLGKLCLRDTNIGDESIKFINKIENLTYLDLQESLVTDEGIEQLSSKLPLEHLDVKSLRGLTNRGLKYIIRTYPKLNLLSISSSGINGEGVRLLPSLHQLGILRISGLELVDDDIVNISTLKLRSLDISNNPITDRSLDMVRKIATLRSLNLEICPSITSEAREKLRRIMVNTKIQPSPDAEPNNPNQEDYKKLYSEDFSPVKLGQ